MRFDWSDAFVSFYSKGSGYRVRAGRICEKAHGEITISDRVGLKYKVDISSLVPSAPHLKCTDGSAYSIGGYGIGDWLVEMPNCGGGSTAIWKDTSFWLEFDRLSLDERTALQLLDEEVKVKRKQWHGIEVSMDNPEAPEAKDNTLISSTLNGSSSEEQYAQQAQRSVFPRASVFPPPHSHIAVSARRIYNELKGFIVSGRAIGAVEVSLIGTDGQEITHSKYRGEDKEARVSLEIQLLVQLKRRFKKVEIIVTTDANDFGHDYHVRCTDVIDENQSFQHDHYGQTLVEALLVARPGCPVFSRY